MIALVAVLATSAAMVLTSCGDDKDEPIGTIDNELTGEWILTNFDEVFPDAQIETDGALTDVAVQFRNDGWFIQYTRLYGQWYYASAIRYGVAGTDSHGRKKLVYEGQESNDVYWFENGELHIYDGDDNEELKFKRTSGIADKAIEYGR